MTFASVALTCRYLLPFGTRYLYRMYQASVFRPRNGFLRKVHASKGLASNVQEILLVGLPLISSVGPRMATDVVIQDVKRLALPYEQKWLALLREHFDVVVEALLIFKCRKALQISGTTTPLFTD
jgi:hypothetical protein